jgi:xanthine dehydrogenase accessory factor
VAVETASGHGLGHVLWTRRTRDLEGEPQEIDGHVRDRDVYAPCSGPFATGHEIGEVVRQGEIVGTVRSASVRAPLSGRLRGLTHGRCGRGGEHKDRGGGAARRHAIRHGARGGGR